VAKPAAKPEPKPAAKPQPKPEPKPVAKPAPAPKPEPVVVAKPEPKPEPKVETVQVAQAPAAAAPAAPKPQASAPLIPAGPPPITPKYNDVMTAVLDGDLAGVQQLLDLGRWADKPDSNGMTPLMLAVLNRDILIVRLLLERGADPNVQAPGGDTAVDMARALGEGQIERELQDRGGR
jgi:ankyrin repeat protein